MLWIRESLREITGTLLLFSGGGVFLEAMVFLVVRCILKKKSLVPFLLAPALAGLLLLMAYPLGYSLVLAFSNMNLHHFREPDYGLIIGWQNLVKLLYFPVLRKTMLSTLLIRTFLWSIFQVGLQFLLALGLALCLNLPIRFKKIFKAILILPWAMPEIIAILSWRGEFHYNYGAVNLWLTRIAGEGAAIPWMLDPLANLTAITVVNQWLGFPFLMVILLSALQGVSPVYLEAAEMEGATGFTRLVRITLPMIKPVLMPTLLLLLTGNFVAFNIPFLLNQNNLESSDFLATALFRTSFVYNQYGLSAMFSWIVSLVLFFFSYLFIRKTNALKGVAE